LRTSAFLPCLFLFLKTGEHVLPGSVIYLSRYYLDRAEKNFLTIISALGAPQTARADAPATMAYLAKSLVMPARTASSMGLKSMDGTVTPAPSVVNAAIVVEIYGIIFSSFP